MTELNANKIIIAAEVVVVCAITYGALALARSFFGREGLWVLGLAGLACALFWLLRLRK